MSKRLSRLADRLKRVQEATGDSGETISLFQPANPCRRCGYWDTPEHRKWMEKHQRPPAQEKRQSWQEMPLKVYVLYCPFKTEPVTLASVVIASGPETHDERQCEGCEWNQSIT